MYKTWQITKRFKKCLIGISEWEKREYEAMWYLRGRDKIFSKTHQRNQVMDPRGTRSKETHLPLSLKDKHLLYKLIVAAREGKMHP